MWLFSKHNGLFQSNTKVQNRATYFVATRIFEKNLATFYNIHIIGLWQLKVVCSFYFWQFDCTQNLTHGYLFTLLFYINGCPSIMTFMVSQNSVTKWLEILSKTHNLVNIQQQTYLQNISTLASPQQDLFSCTGIV